VPHSREPVGYFAQGSEMHAVHTPMPRPRINRLVLLRGLMISLPLWALIIWGVRRLVLLLGF
jgi:hypothetical protein